MIDGFVWAWGIWGWRDVVVYGLLAVGVVGLVRGLIFAGRVLWRAWDPYPGQSNLCPQCGSHLPFHTTTCSQ